MVVGCSVGSCKGPVVLVGAEPREAPVVHLQGLGWLALLSPLVMLAKLSLHYIVVPLAATHS